MDLLYTTGSKHTGVVSMTSESACTHNHKEVNFTVLVETMATP